MSLLRAFATVGTFTLLSRIAGFARDMLIAAFLGAGAAADAFFVAFQFPNLFRRLFAEGAFSAGFVPIFSGLLERQGRPAALAFAAEAAAVLALVLALFSAAVMAAMPWVLLLIAPGFAEVPGQMERAAALARITFPYLFFISLVSLQSGVLNALDRFAAAAAAPILLNLTLIAFLLGSVRMQGDPALFLAVGVSAAGVIQFLWMLAHCRRAGAALALARPRLTPAVKDLMRRMLPVAFGAGVYQLNLVINNILATLVSVGAVSWLYFADRVNQLPLGVIGVAVGVALLPLLSRQIQSGRDDAALANQNRAVEVTMLLTVPAAVGIAALAEPIAAVLYERGAFGHVQRAAVAGALTAFSLGLPAYVLVKALTPGFFSRHDTGTPVKVSVAALAANVAAALVLMRFYGHVGIALATTLSAWLNAGGLAAILYRRGHLRPDWRLRFRLPRIFGAAGIMLLALWMGLTFVDGVLGPVFGLPGAEAGPEVPRALALAGLVVFGAAVYGIAAVLLGAARREDIAQFRRESRSSPN